MGIGTITATAVAMALASFAARLRFPTVPKPLASAIFFGAVAYLVWSICPTKANQPWWVPASVTLIVASVAGMIDARYFAKVWGPKEPESLIKPKRPKRDTLLREAFVFAILREWGKTIDDAASNCENLEVPFKQIHQLALDGEITIWGREKPGGLYHDIHKRHWRDHDIDWFSLVRGEPFSTPHSADPPMPVYRGCYGLVSPNRFKGLDEILPQALPV